MRNIPGETCRENQNTHFIVKNFFAKENCAYFGIRWKNIVEADRPQMTIWCVRVACRIPKATNTLRICNTYCFSTTTMVGWTRRNVTL